MDMISKRESQDDINICNTRAGIEDDVRRPGLLYSKINGIGSLPSIPTCSNRSSKCKMLFHRLEQTDFKSPESCSSLEAAELCLIANEVHSKLYSCVSRVSLHSHENQQYHSWPKQKQTWKKFNHSPYHNFGLDTAVDKNQKQARRLCEKDKDVLNAEKLVRIESVKNNNIDRYVSVAVQDSNISGKRDRREYLLDEAEKFLPGTVSNCMTSDEYYQRACLEKRKSEFESVYDAMIENLQQIDSALKISQTSYMSNDQTSSQQEQFSESKQKFEHTSHWVCDDKFIENVDSIVCSDITENLSSSSFEDSGSDSGLGQYSDFNPFLFSSNGISPPLFKKRKDLMMQWFASFSNEQKNIFLQQTIASCGLPQMHMLSLKLEPVLHKNCPQNCCDMLQWLPEVVVYCILEYLDPVSLSSASIVNRTWYSFSQHQLLWQRFCSCHDYSLSSARHCEQMKKHTMPDGIINWRNVFVERYLCKRNWRKGKCKVKSFVGHTQGVKFNSLTYVSIPGVSCVQFDNKRIVSGSSDKTIRVWDLTSDSTEPVLTLVGHFGTVRCLQLRGNRVVSGSADATIKVWDLSVGSDWNMATCRVTMVGHLDTVRCLQVDEDKVISGSYDNTLKVWDVTTGRCKLTLRGHSAGVLCVQFDDQKIVSGSSDNTIKVWNLFTGVCLATLRGHQDAVTCLQFNQHRIISGSLDCTLKFWDLNSGQCIGTIDWIRSEGHTRVVRCLQADHWKIVSAGDDKTLKIWCLKTGERFVTLHQHTDGVTCLQFDDVMIVSGSYDKTVKVWNFLP